MRVRTIVISSAAVGTAGWVIYRVTQRARLEKLLDESSAVAIAQSTGAIAWTARERAGDAITFFNTIPADQAFTEILASLPPPETKFLEPAWDVVQDLKEQVDDIRQVPRGTTRQEVEGWTNYAQSWLNWWEGNNE